MEGNLKIRIGINTDEAITGNIGSLERIQFSAIGDGVNIASRLESANKVYGTGILISGKTARLLGKNYFMREIDTVFVSGKNTPIDIYELMSSQEYNSDLVNKYSEALKCYRNKNFDSAMELWSQCLKIKENDNPSKVMYDRALKLKQYQITSKLTENWQPIWSLENK